jgi:hypothetical protein
LGVATGTTRVGTRIGVSAGAAVMDGTAIGVGTRIGVSTGAAVMDGTAIGVGPVSGASTGVATGGMSDGVVTRTS